MPRDSHITLNFTPEFIERLKAYAEANHMKLNAVVRQAFQLLEDHPELVVRKTKDEYGY